MECPRRLCWQLLKSALTTRARDILTWESYKNLHFSVYFPVTEVFFHLLQNKGLLGGVSVTIQGTLLQRTRCILETIHSASRRLRDSVIIELKQSSYSEGRAENVDRRHDNFDKIGSDTERVLP